MLIANCENQNASQPFVGAKSSALQGHASVRAATTCYGDRTILNLISQTNLKRYSIHSAIQYLTKSSSETEQDALIPLAQRQRLLFQSLLLRHRRPQSFISSIQPHVVVFEQKPSTHSNSRDENVDLIASVEYCRTS